MSLVITPVTGHRTNNVSCQLNQSILHYVSLMLHWSLIRGNLDIRPSGVGHDSIQVSVTNIAQICNVANFVATQFLSPHYCGVQLESYVGWSTLSGSCNKSHRKSNFNLFRVLLSYKTGGKTHLRRQEILILETVKTR